MKRGLVQFNPQQLMTPELEMLSSSYLPGFRCDHCLGLLCLLLIYHLPTAQNTTHDSVA